MLLRNKIVSLSESGDIDKMMQYLGKAKTCSADIYLSAYSSFVEKGHIAIAMPLLKEGLEHYPENQVSQEIVAITVCISECKVYKVYFLFLVLTSQHGRTIHGPQRLHHGY